MRVSSTLWPVGLRRTPFRLSDVSGRSKMRLKVSLQLSWLGQCVWQTPPIPPCYRFMSVPTPSVFRFVVSPPIPGGNIHLGRFYCSCWHLKQKTPLWFRKSLSHFALGHYGLGSPTKSGGRWASFLLTFFVCARSTGYAKANKRKYEQNK